MRLGKSVAAFLQAADGHSLRLALSTLIARPPGYQFWKLMETNHQPVASYVPRPRPHRSAAHKNNVLGVRGVSLLSSGRYQVRVYLNRRTLVLGTYPTLDQATAARDLAEAAVLGRPMPRLAAVLAQAHRS